MAGIAGYEKSPSMNDLLLRGQEFSFNQVMRVARLHLAAGGAQGLPEVSWQERVEVRPNLSLAFPAADVAKVESAGDDGADLLITVTFLCLYGTSSPLPTHYTEDLIEEAEADSSVGRDFLDILHQRLYHLYFQCWSKYRLFIRIVEEKNPRDLERLFCLIGLGEKELRDSLPDPTSPLRYIGLFNQFPRSAQGLQTLLRDALGVHKLNVELCVLRKVQIPEDQRTLLGMANISVGGDSVLGSEVVDRMGKFRIHIGPLTRNEFDCFIPGTRQHDKLASLIRLFVVDPFEYDLHLIMAAGEAQPTVPGASEGGLLGLNSWCFSGDSVGEVNAIFPIAHTAAHAPAPTYEFGSAPEPKGPSTLVDYYQVELAQLRNLAAIYAKAHPAIASIVTANPADPGVERLFEGVAFLNANLQRKLADNFPEIIHDVIHALQPNYLRPVPATTILVFSPKPNCTEPQTIPAGTELKSVPVDETACRFTTRYPVEIHPLTLTNASLSQPCGKTAAITLSLKLAGLRLAEWNLKSLRLFLAGEYNNASNLYLVLMRYLKKIVIAPVQEGQSIMLDATNLKAVGFNDTEVLFPSGAPGGASCGQMMYEFFVQPDKFLFLDLQGWETWRERGDGSEFEIHFELDQLPFELHDVSNTDFALFATPAVNVFHCEAEPIAIDSQQLTYQVIPAGSELGLCDIYSVEHVTGILSETNQKIPFQPVSPQLLGPVLCQLIMSHGQTNLFVKVLMSSFPFHI